ncbi:MAG: aspartyl/asparaginyl beta-hydroxylase domain-containing protein [Chitinophagales bacterium]|jgi:beta-hydroxylase|nr:aspartyl/asparaginyl beta-hydroxylase domain-containing protein [Chitinophagales bacterium]HNI45432.1 aspartyl/asparaginyl beta-hydroxylase domain-containing protein [Chitinophagales bacterium]
MQTTEQPTYFYNKEDFPWYKILEDNVDIIRQELETVMSSPASHKLSKAWMAAHPSYVKSETGQEIAWKVYSFIFLGIRHQFHCEQCPNTYRLLSQIPGITGAEFSMMEPGTHILPHKGYTRMVLRSHLALVVPKDPTTCALRVGDQTRHWQQGKVWVFDDSHEHEAWNKSNERRAVLMFDIANPEMGYTADQICRYKLERADDPFMLKIAPPETWLQWYEQGYFPEAE